MTVCTGLFNLKILSVCNIIHNAITWWSIWIYFHFQKDETFKSLKISNVRTLLQPIMTNSTTDFNELVFNFRRYHYDTRAYWFKIVENMYFASIVFSITKLVD